MSPKAIKTSSLILLAMATFLMALRIINFKMVSVAHAGLWNFIPSWLRTTLFAIYPVLMVSSGVLFGISRKEKTRFDLLIPALFLLNGLCILFIIVVVLAIRFLS